MDFLNKILKTKYKKVFTTDKKGLCVLQQAFCLKGMPQIKQIFTNFILYAASYLFVFVIKRYVHRFDRFSQIFLCVPFASQRLCGSKLSPLTQFQIPLFLFVLLAKLHSPFVFKKICSRIKKIFTDFSLCPFCVLASLWF